MQTPVIKLCCKTCSHSGVRAIISLRYCYRKKELKECTDFCNLWESTGEANNKAIAEFKNNNKRNTENE